MSMLAEPRRKQKISSNPNGLSFINDEGNIGQKLLSQMGWEKGKGIGLNQQGMKDPIKMKINMESRGLGCRRSDVDKWIAHQDDFNSVLADLNQTKAPDTDSKEEDAAVISLEAKSKSSKSRIHYMKFTKGKDLSKHSDRDLVCILGPGKSENNTPEGRSPALDQDKADETDPFLSDSRVTTSSLSLQEYFASKLASKKNSSATFTDAAVADEEKTNSDETSETVTTSGTPSFFIGDDEPETTKPSKKSKKVNLKDTLCEQQEDTNITSDRKNKKLNKKKKQKKKHAEEKLNHSESKEEARHRSGGKTKPLPVDDTMQFISDSTDEDADQAANKDQESKKRQLQDTDCQDGKEHSKERKKKTKIS